MSTDEEVYCQEKARALDSLRSKCKLAKQHCSKHLGSIVPPLLNGEPFRIVLDELHLMLRIRDVLIRNLVWQADSRDHCDRERDGESTNHVQYLERVIRSCEVCFCIWQKKERTRNQIPGSCDWTALSCKHKLQVLQRLPGKMPAFLPGDSCSSIAILWNVS